MSDSKSLLDPKELLPAGAGLAIGVGLLVFFYLLAVGIGMPTLAETWALPRQ